MMEEIIIEYLDELELYETEKTGGKEIRFHVDNSGNPYRLQKDIKNKFPMCFAPYEAQRYSIEQARSIWVDMIQDGYKRV